MTWEAKTWLEMPEHLDLMMPQLNKPSDELAVAAGRSSSACPRLPEDHHSV